MNEDWKWCFAESLAGHDKGAVYIIVEADSDYVYLADGRTRLLEKPKKKKKKHIQIIKYKDSGIENKYRQYNKIMNEDIKRAIKIYISSNKEE
jgi:hypothetical protein